MAGVRTDRIRRARPLMATLALAALAAFAGPLTHAAAQSPPATGPLLAPPGTAAQHPAAPLFAPNPEAAPAAAVPIASEAQPLVVQVRVEGRGQIPLPKILPHIKTREGRPFDPKLLEEDVRRLHATGLFVSVRPLTQAAEGGLLVIFQLYERPIFAEVLYVGNEAIKKKKLATEAHISPGDPVDSFEVAEARRRIEEYYHSHGFAKARVSVLEGDKPEDRRVIFLINEGVKQRILWTNFVGNAVATDARLRTQIQSKPGIAWLFKGELNRDELQQDRDRLTDYYRKLGYFQAKVGQPLLDAGDDGKWLTVTFVIHEGPRYTVRNISFLGNQKFSTADLAKKVELRSGEFFNRDRLNADAAAVSEKYGGIGHVFAKVEPDVRLPEDPAQATADIVFHVEEGNRYRVGRIRPQIAGEATHTRVTTILNRMQGIEPGDIVDIRKLRDAERRLRASQLFEVDPSKGDVPKIVFSPPELEGDEDATAIASRAGSAVPPRSSATGPHADTSGDMPGRLMGARFQSPDPDDALVDLVVQGTLTPDAVPAAPVAPAPPPPLAHPPAPVYCAPVAEPVRPAPAARPAAWTTQRRDFALSEAAGALENALGLAPAAVSQFASAEGTIRQASFTTAAPQPDALQFQSAPLAPQQEALAPRSEPSIPPPAARDWRDADARVQLFYLDGQAQWIVRGQYSPGAGRAMPSLDAASGGRFFPQLTSPRASDAPSTAAASYNSVPTAPAPIEDAEVTPAQYIPRMPEAGALNTGTLPGMPEEEIPLYIPLDPMVTEARTGRLMLSAGINSDAGLLFSAIIEEQNFDISRWPRSWYDIRSGQAFRGAGQRFRVEAVPGTRVQRYTINFTEPYLFDTNVSFGVSGFYYTRNFFEWDEERIGGRLSLGYQLTPDLSASFAFRAEEVDIQDIIADSVPELAEVEGSNALYGFRGSLTYDTRDNAFLPTEGFIAELGLEQVIGSFEYPRANFELRNYFLLHQRPDTSGRHVLSLGGSVAWSGEDTPVYEHYFAGGYSSLRGFDFRGASPRNMDVFVGGEFMTLASAEYMFPITADDMIRGVVFVDTGTVQPQIDDWTDRYRVAPGFGLRITIPALGPAPIALDFAFPVVHEPGDDIQVFSFWMGFMR